MFIDMNKDTFELHNAIQCSDKIRATYQDEVILYTDKEVNFFD